MTYKGLVSDSTLLGLVPFVKDADEELKKVQEQKEENLSLYNFPDSNIEGEDKEEE
jgi:hypothetical protein